MGSHNSKPDYSKYILIREEADDELGYLSVLQDPKDKSQMVLLKTYLSNETKAMLTKSSDMKALMKIAKSYPEMFTKALLLEVDEKKNFCTIEDISAKIYFEYVPYNLFRFCEEHIQRNHILQPNELEDMLKFFMNIGIWMEDRQEYHPYIGMRNVLMTKDGYKLTNPFIYPAYIHNKGRNILDPVGILKFQNAWTPKLLVPEISGGELKAIISKINTIFELIRNNVMYSLNQLTIITLNLIFILVLNLVVLSLINPRIFKNISNKFNNCI